MHPTRNPTASRRREGRPDLLARPPIGEPAEEPWVVPVADSLEQLRALADLLDRGLISREEFDNQKAKVPGP